MLAVATVTDDSLTEESLDKDLEDYFNRDKSDESMHNDFTDSYVLSSFNNPFSEPHLLLDALLHATIPTSSLPLSVPINAMIDTGCPPTVISGALVASLGLPLILLPPKEDNLSSLSNSRLPCSRYVNVSISRRRGNMGSRVQLEQRLLSGYLYHYYWE